jgi:hypothetical protein
MCSRGASKKVLAPTYIQPSATDHDFVGRHIIPSVIVVGVIPDKLDGHWYDARMVIITLKNQPFKPSRAIRHAVEISQNVIGHQQAPVKKKCGAIILCAYRRTSCDWVPEASTLPSSGIRVRADIDYGCSCGINPVLLLSHYSVTVVSILSCSCPTTVSYSCHCSTTRVPSYP